LKAIRDKRKRKKGKKERKREKRRRKTRKDDGVLILLGIPFVIHTPKC
jgi:hypothetical protein